MATGGLDIGTSGCKFVLFHSRGEMILESKRSYKEYGTDGIREIHPEEVWRAVVEVLTEAAAGCREPIEGFAITTLGESFVAVDSKDSPLCASMVTGDKRGIAESRRLMEQFGESRLMELTGVPPSEMYALPKMMWTNENTDVFRHARYLFMYEDYMAYLLTGERKITYSQASRSMAFDIRKKEWCGPLLALAGLKESMMSEPVPSGTVIGKLRKEICELTGLSKDVLLVAGGHDQMCAALGNGVLGPDVCGDGMGTCEVMSAVLPGAYTGKGMSDASLPCVPYLSDSTYLTYLVMTNCGSLMNWYRDMYMNDKYLSRDIRPEQKFDYMDQEAGNEPTGLLVIPNFGSAGNPHIDYNARGTVWGLTIHTEPGEMFRGYKEGMAYHMKLCFDSLDTLGIKPKLIRASGGGARSDVTMQIRADVFGLPVCRMGHTEAGARGCMLLTASVLGYYRDAAEAFQKTVSTERTFYPDEKNHTRYMELYEKYKKLYEMLYKFHL